MIYRIESQSREKRDWQLIAFARSRREAVARQRALALEAPGTRFRVLAEDLGEGPLGEEPDPFPVEAQRPEGRVPPGEGTQPGGPPKNPHGLPEGWATPFPYTLPPEARNAYVAEIREGGDIQIRRAAPGPRKPRRVEGVDGF